MLCLPPTPGLIGVPRAPRDGETAEAPLAPIMRQPLVRSLPRFTRLTPLQPGQALVMPQQ